jgi:hypothetical protein
MSTGPAVLFAMAVVWLSVVGCSKSSSTIAPLGTNKRVLPGAVPPPTTEPVAAPTEGTPTPTAPMYAHEAILWDGAPTTYTLTERIDAAAVRPDPDLAVVQSGREAGAACFSGLQGGPDERYALIQVVVVPTGAVSRAVVSGVAEPDVLDCLRRVGGGLRFSDRTVAPTGALGGSTRSDNGAEGIRSFSIDIHLSRAH